MEEETAPAQFPVGADLLSEEEMKDLPPVHILKNVSKSASLKQMLLLARNDRRRLQKINSRGSYYNVTHICVHCSVCLYLS